MKRASKLLSNDQLSMIIYRPLVDFNHDYPARFAMDNRSLITDT